MTRSLRAAMALLTAACTLGTASSAAHANTLDVAILGDSYSSGVGGGSYDFSLCFRSPYTWGQVYAGLVRTTGLTVNVTNVACGGAVVEDLAEQMDAITPDTDLVLLTAGGNNVDFGDIIPRCFMPVVAGPQNCRSTIEAGEDKIPSVRDELETQLRALYAKLRPGAKVVFLAYPHIAQPSGYLLQKLFVSYDSGAGVRHLWESIDQATTDAIDAANADAGYEFAQLVSPRDRFVGHEPDQNPYAENPQRWIFEFTGQPAVLDYYHPTKEGFQAMGEAAFDAAGPASDFGVSQ